VVSLSKEQWHCSGHQCQGSCRTHWSRACWTHGWGSSSSWGDNVGAVGMLAGETGTFVGDPPGADAGSSVQCTNVIWQLDYLWGLT